ncbi:G-protein coupled receptor GRL101-like [Antedon mediterranea]|uniref:G-protein coupled receptor GRL101-like n=1 Tax=Antedon mediterranea TaxID=105859 RepID=UPI003AF8F9CB
MKLQYHYLVALDISGNNIRVITNNMFSELANLKRLYIQENKLTKLEDNVFENANNLLYLDMHANGIKQLNRHTFSGLNKLEYLDISDNNIDLENKDIFVDLQSLKTLKSDDYFFCCLLDSARHIECTPTADIFSSCENLMQNQIIRVFLWIFGLSALLGNMFVIFWRWKHWPTTRSLCSKQYILITNLAVADMLMGIYLLIIATADVLFRNNYVIHANDWKASVACTFAGVLAFLSSESSVYILSVISFDRFLHIAFPFANVHFTQKTIKGVIAFGWVLTLVMSILPVLPIPYFNNEFYGVTSVCLALPLTSEKVRGWEYTAAIIIGFNTLCFLIIFVCYTAIFMFIKASSRNIKQTGTNNSDKNQHIAIAMRMAFIVATDFCCWVPIIVMGILSLTRTVYIPPEAYAWAAVFVLPINSAINPYLYTFVTLKKRQKQRNVSKYVTEKTNECSGMKTGEREYGTHFTKTSNERTVVEMIEYIIRSQKLSDKSVNVEILQHLSEVLDLAKKYNTDISQIDVGNRLHPNIVTTTTKL